MRGASFASVLALLTVAGGCHGPASGRNGDETLAAPKSATTVDHAPLPVGSADVPAQPDAGGPPALATPTVHPERALEVVFGAEAEAGARECLAKPGDPDKIRCLLERRFAADAEARESALDLFEQGGIVTGINPRLDMDGGWRGKLRLVPELPVGPHRRHVAWVASAHRDLDSFFGRLAQHADRSIDYRWRTLELRFFRSVGRTTPSAYAEAWAIAYNVSGSLHSSAEAVRETWFHEIFHLNDHAHGGWSEQVLAPLYDSIVAKCSDAGGRLSTPCLTPFTPNHTMVRGGTYYAFQPGNGVGEYAAELALRYYREQRDHLDGRPASKPAFKCGPDPSREAWTALANEFFAGVDLIADC